MMEKIKGTEETAQEVSAFGAFAEFESHPVVHNCPQVQF